MSMQRLPFQISYGKLLKVSILRIHDAKNGLEHRKRIQERLWGGSGEAQERLTGSSQGRSMRRRESGLGEGWCHYSKKRKN